MVIITVLDTNLFIAEPFYNEGVIYGKTLQKKGIIAFNRSLPVSFILSK